MNEFINGILNQIQTFPLWGLILFAFISACIQQVFPPYPSEVLLLIFGGLAITGVIPGVPVIIAYISGTIISSLLVFYFSRRLGKPVLNNRFVKKIFSRRNQRRARVYVKRFGAPSLIFCKFLPGVNTVCIIVAGVMGLRGLVPNLCIAVASVVANMLYFVIGMLIGNNVSSAADITKSITFFAAAIAVVIAAAVFIMFKFKGKKLRKIFR